MQLAIIYISIQIVIDHNLTQTREQVVLYHVNLVSIQMLSTELELFKRYLYKVYDHPTNP